MGSCSPRRRPGFRSHRRQTAAQFKILDLAPITSRLTLQMPPDVLVIGADARPVWQQLFHIRVARYGKVESVGRVAFRRSPIT